MNRKGGGVRIDATTDTWSRIVNGQWKSSILDHVYVTDPEKAKT